MKRIEPSILNPDMPSLKHLLIAWLVFSVSLGLPANGLGQSSATTANHSTIFPSLATKQKQDAVIWPEPDVKQSSPIRQTVFEQPEPSPAVTGAPEPLVGSPQPALSGGDRCPDCGRPLDHPILGTCDSCTGPGRRLLCMLRPGWIFGGRDGPSPPHEPWMYRPYSVGVFVGPVAGSPLIDDWVGQQTGTLAGMRLGLDMDDDWGMEMRLATANIPIYDSEAAIEAQRNMTQIPIPAPLGTRNADQFLWDIDFLYYPWADSYFRPYLLFGLGTDRIKFTDRLGNNYARILLGMPVGLGIKTHLNDWMIFRIEFTDNMAFAGGSIFQSQHNVSLTGAFEVRFGRPRTIYWPWNPGR